MEAAVRTHIDEETVRLMSALSNFYIQRNSPCCIYRLPTEIFESIFVHYACDYHTDIGHPIPTAPSWVNVSYVCRRWRNIALNCPTLWTYLFITSPRWTEELLVRSKQEPLKLHVNLHRRDKKHRGLRFLEQVITHIERIQELHFHIPCTDRYHDQLFSISGFSSCAPRLQTLNISVGDNPPGDWFFTIFDGDTPALRILELSRCSVLWSTFKLNALTTLSLHRVPILWQQGVEHFLASLSCIQDLRHLYLDHALGGGLPSRAEFHTLQKTNLPRLSRLLIAEPLSTVLAFLLCVTIPSKTEVRLGCRSEPDYTPDDYAPFYPLLAQRFGMSEDQALSDPTIRSLVVTSAEEGEAKLTFSTALGREYAPFVSPSFTDWYWGCNIPLQIVVHLDRLGVASVMDRIISNICCSIPLANVQSVHVVGPPFSSAFWRRLLGRLRDLRYLKLSEGNMPNLASVLSFPPLDRTENRGGYRDSDPGRIYAPALEELELCDIVFSTSLEGSMYPFAADVQSLCHALSTRKERRDRLTMIGCTEYDPDYQEKEFDMVGWWEGGSFHVVDERNSDSP